LTKIRFLLDTNILSEPLRPRPNLEVVTMLQQQEGAIATATVVFHELLFGCYRLPIESNIAVPRCIKCISRTSPPTPLLTKERGR
jgi:predicted nucleic acid-binding protein